MKSKCFIFDLDGTIFDCDHRKHFITTKPKNWKAFSAGIIHDTVIEWVATIARRTFQRGEIAVVIVTAREGSTQIKRDTEEALKKAGIKYDAIYFRDSKDYRDDTLVKSEILQKVKDDGFNPVLVFDDRPKVVRMWREHGLTVVDCGDGKEF